jgi:Carboxypeptidase regulatory-like domain
MPRNLNSLFVCLAAVCLPHVLFAQTSQGRFSGQVTDPSGAVVPGATVTIENLGTHVSRVLRTDSAGQYVAAAVEPGFYSLTAEAQGFAKLVRERVHLEVAQEVNIDFNLTPGAITQTVEVQSEAPLTETANAVLTGVLSNKPINELPLQGRDFQNLLPLHPGVQRTPGGGFHSTTSNGNRPDDNNYIIDGATDNDAYYGETVVGDAGVQGTPASHLPLDAITEFNTMEGPQADYGAKPGVVVNVGLKSGTNDLHGTTYYFHRNSDFDARNYFNPVVPGDPAASQISALLLHQFGASLGGPIIKNKWFYFVDYEGVRDKVGNPFAAASPITVSLATPANPAGDPTRSLVDARNQALADGYTISPISQTLVDKGIFLPNPGGTVDPNNPELIDFDFNNVNREDNLVFKSDFHLNSQNTFSGRFIYANTSQTEEDTVPLRPEWLSHADVRTQVFGVDWTWTPTPRVTNQARFSYNSFWEKIAPLDSTVNPATAWGLNTGITDPNLQGFPRITPGSIFDYLGGNASWPLWTTPSRTDNVSDTASYIVGKHTLRWGGNFQRGDVDYLRGNNARGRISFRTLEDFWIGDPRNGELLVGDLKRNVSLNSVGFFLNDDYRMTRRLTLNLGVRYEITPPIKEANNLIATFVPDQGVVQVGKGIDAPYPTRYNNVSPRLGVAWDVFGTGKTVVRAGGGIIFEQPSIRTFINGSGLNLNPSGIAGVQPGNGTINTFLRFLGSGDINFTDPSQPVFNVGAGSSFCDPDPNDESGCFVFGTARNLKTPYVANWNFNIQQALTPSTLLQVAYVANKGIKLYSNRDINQPNSAQSAACILNVDGLGPIDAYSNVDYLPCEQVSRPFFPVYPSLQSIVILGNDSTSSYNSLQVTLTKRYTHGLYLLAGYTWAHAIDTATSNLASVPQNSYDYRADRGNGDYDIRHRFTLSLTYDIPSFRAPWQLGKGWQITSIVTLEGGEPFTLSDATNDVSATGEFSDRWNITGPGSDIHWTQTGAGNPCNTQTQLCFIDPSTFTLDPTGTHVIGGGDPRCISAAGNQAAVDQLANVGCYIEGRAILTPPALGTFGDLGRNAFRGPGLRDWDASLSKLWKFNERVSLQLRGEFFNLLNHPNFDDFTMHTDMGDGATLGRVIATPDVGESNPVIGTGGSRHIQLGAKIVW